MAISFIRAAAPNSLDVGAFWRNVVLDCATVGYLVSPELVFVLLEL